MGTEDLILTCVASAVASAVLTACVRNYAERRLIDIPNERSSHRVATPRGGGAAFITAFSGSSAVVAAMFAGWHTWFLLVPGVIFVAIVGFLDDHISLGAGTRLAVHFVAAGGVVVFSCVEEHTIFGLMLARPVGTVCAIVVIVWIVNLYNFMDGINGLAAVEAIFVSGAGALFEWYAGNTIGAIFLALLGCAVAGFLPWNFPKAKIFMGDVGSGALGFIFGCFLVLAWARNESHFFAWSILLAAFVGDASWTLLVRLAQRAPILEAHRTHAYQHAAARWGHPPVTLFVSVINCLLLLPLSFIAFFLPEVARWCTFIAYLMVLSLAIWLRAGAREEAVRTS